MNRITSLTNLRIEPALILEPPGMLNDDSPVPKEPEVLQQLFKRAVVGTPLAQLHFIPGSELLLATRDLLRIVEEVARIRSIGVSTIGEAELAGGYAFLNDGMYAFGVEDDSTLQDTVRWEEAIGELIKQGKARIRHACDQFIRARLENETVILTHERSTNHYLVDFEVFRAQVAEAVEELRKFAFAFTPAYVRELSRSLSPDRAREAAYDNFKNRPHWISELG